VQRLHAEDDRRKVLVQITRKGIDLVERMRQDIVHTLAETMASMEEREQVALGRDFERLAASFEKHQSSSS
jgi:DNA-binding MarR family transcriptional regulator